MSFFVGAMLVFQMAVLQVSDKEVGQSEQASKEILKRV